MSAGIVIAGGGLAGQRCAETLRRCGYERPIVIVCGEPHPPYDRPPLSKQVLAAAEAEEALALRRASWYADRDIELILGARLAALRPAARTVALADGRELDYEQLLIATGARPRGLAVLAGLGNVSTLRTLADARRLRDALRRGSRLLIVGAGFIGQEVAAAASRAGVRTTVVETAKQPLEGLLGPEVGGWFARLHRESGVELVLGDHVASVHGARRADSVVLASGRQIECDHALLAIGIAPDTAWLHGSGLSGPEGVRTDCDGRTAAPGVLAAGDAAATFEPLLGRHVAGGHWEAAARQGARAARTMLGLEPGTLAPASFWSDLYGTRIQYVGHAGLADRVLLDGDPSLRDFTATYTRAGRPVAVLLAGRPHELQHARELLTTGERSNR
jgi:NADPH-dependent 2,4-dienoyl-CoA reductase/sulfur reductase-like enzyme